MSKYAIILDENNRILSATFEKYANENYILVDRLPDGNITDYLYIDGEYVYSPITVELTPEQQREQAYETMEIIEWQGASITVDEANDLWLKYSAEGSDTANTLSALIVTAKDKIRKMYPNE